MFVGDVRCATTGRGSSWKLSGGSPLSSGPTNVSKNSQVRRAVRRSVSTSSVERFSTVELGRRKADPLAIRGANNHTTTNGAASDAASGSRTHTAPAVAAAITTLPAICR